MTDTPHLGLPLIEASQAQKHVTHNEAIKMLDAIVHLSVKDSTHTAPPAAVEGDRYRVASGATGAWADWDLNIALYTDGAWTKLVPLKGWTCFDEETGIESVYVGVPDYWLDYTAPGEDQLATIASAATTDLGSTPARSMTITGTTTITSFGSSAPTGAVKFIEFAGALTLTHNATSLILPNATNIATNAGTCCMARHEGSGNWRVMVVGQGLAGGFNASAMSTITVNGATPALKLIQNATGVLAEGFLVTKNDETSNPLPCSFGNGVFRIGSPTGSRFGVGIYDLTASGGIKQIVFDTLNGFVFSFKPNGTETLRLDTGAVIAPNMPTADPHVVGQLWNSAGTVKISAG